MYPNPGKGRRRSLWERAGGGTAGLGGVKAGGGAVGRWVQRGGDEDRRGHGGMEGRRGLVGEG